MSRRKAWIVVLLCAIAMSVGATAARADDVFPPSWRHGDLLTGTVDPGAVAVGFDGWGGAGSGPGFILVPEHMLLTNPGGLNPGGSPSSLFAAYAHWDSNCAVVDPMFGRPTVLEINYPGYTIPVFFGVANYDAGNPLKKMRVQITFADAGTGPMDFELGYWASNPGGPPWQGQFVRVDAIVKAYKDHEDGWGTRLYELEWRPNPSYEGFGLYFGTVPGACYIDQVIIDTICTSDGPPIAEPVALSLLGLGGLALRRRRRR